MDDAAPGSTEADRALATAHRLAATRARLRRAVEKDETAAALEQRLLCRALPSTRATDARAAPLRAMLHAPTEIGRPGLARAPSRTRG